MCRVPYVPLKMSDRRRLWRLTLSVALLALVIGATTLGMVWHDHAISSPDTCPICHLSHQTIEPSVVSVRVYTPVATDTSPEPRHINFTSSSDLLRIPPRAPPV